MKNQNIITVAALLTTTWLTPTFAQASASTDGGHSKSKGLEEIIVTAQRRSQKLQSVPLSVTAFSRATLARTGVTNTLAVQQVDPSLVVSTGSGINAPFIRGVGNASATGLGNEASVPVYIDDVYFSRLNTAYLELANVDSVEVLKGPQGTLFGRNSSGGAILITTRDPGPKWRVEAEVGYANYDTLTGKAYAAGPITDWLGVGLSISGQNQGDGWGRNINTGAPTYQDDFINLRGKVVIRPFDTTKITISSFYANSINEQGSFNTIYPGTVAGAPPLAEDGGPGPLVAPRNYYDENEDRNSTLYAHGWGVSVKIEQDLHYLDLVSITSFRDGTEAYYGDGNHGASDYLRYNLYQYDREATQEVQMKSKKTSKIDWILGAFFLDSRVGYDPTTISGDAFTSQGIAHEDIYGQETIKSYSGYGQATVPVFSDRNHFTAGVRYSADHVQGVGRTDIVIPGLGTIPLASYNQAVPFKKVTYKFAIDRKLTDTILGYASYSRGYKSGTFNLLPVSMSPTKPEVVDAYEVGLKTTLFDNQLRLNAAIFQSDISEPQVETLFVSDGVGFVGLTNAKGARVRGVEFNADARINDELTARFGATYLNAYYTDFTDAPFYYPGGPPNYGLSPAVQGNATGNTLAQIPKWRFTGGANYDVDTRLGHFNADANLAYTGKFAWNPDNFLKQKAYYLLNATVTYDPAGHENWFVRVYAKNLLGEKYQIAELENQGIQAYEGAPGAPRTYGASVGFHF